ncbi:MAG: LysE family transporter [Kiritimatiellae bacterium]|nr:LysE family transporter [Kiritimatiellia bacterium]
MPAQELFTIVRVFAFAFVVGLTGAMMPGSMLALVIAETRKHGVWAGPLTVLGHMVLEIATVLLLLLGIGRFLQAPAFRLSVSVAGGAVLVWMGIGMLRSHARLDLDSTAGASVRARRATPIVGGVITSLSNPYFTIWWATIGLAMITEATARIETRWLAAAVFFAGHILSDLIWYTLVSFSLSAGKRFIPDSVYRGLIRVAAAAVIALGVYYGYQGVTLALG